MGESVGTPGTRLSDTEETCVASADPPPDNRTIARLLGGLFALAVLTALYFAAELVIPIAAAVLLYIILSPIQRRLIGWRLPSALAATMIAGLLAASVAVAGVGLAAPAANWVEQAPKIAVELRWKLRNLMATFAGLKRASEEVQELIEGKGGGTGASEKVVVREWNLLDRVARSLGNAGVQIMVIFALLWFLLAFGDALRRAVEDSAETDSVRRRILVVLGNIERDTSRFMLTIATINVILGTVLSLVFLGLGMPNPFLWGAMAAVLNFMPYIGAIIGVSIVFVVSLMSFEGSGYVLLAPAIYATINILEGQWLTPLILGRSLTMNPVIIFVFVVFWAWMWGVPGALMAVPILVVIRATCVHATPQGVARGLTAV